MFENAIILYDLLYEPGTKLPRYSTFGEFVLNGLMNGKPTYQRKFIKSISNLDKFGVVRFNSEISLNDAHIFVPGQENEPNRRFYGCFYLDVFCLDQY